MQSDYAESEDELIRRVSRARLHFSEIKCIIDELPPLEKIEDAMRRLGAPMTAYELGVDKEMLDLSMHCAKDYRTRYTLFKLIAECGLEDVYLEEMSH